MTAAEKADLKELRDEVLVGFRRIEDLIEQRRRDDATREEVTENRIDLRFSSIDVRLRTLEKVGAIATALSTIALTFGSFIAWHIFA